MPSRSTSRNGVLNKHDLTARGWLIGMSSAAPETHSVVVVGAGLAGLYAAKLLQQRFPDIIVLEATEQPGGRVKQASVDDLLIVVCELSRLLWIHQVHGIAPWPIEAGPQFVHGANSSLKVRHPCSQAAGNCLHPGLTCLPMYLHACRRCWMSCNVELKSTTGQTGGTWEKRVDFTRPQNRQVAQRQPFTVCNGKGIMKQ